LGQKLVFIFSSPGKKKKEEEKKKPAHEPHPGALPRFGTKACHLRERAPAGPQKTRGAAHPEAFAPLFPV
jgi:hypothetical protein